MSQRPLAISTTAARLGLAALFTALLLGLAACPQQETKSDTSQAAAAPATQEQSTPPPAEASSMPAQEESKPAEASGGESAGKEESLAQRIAEFKASRTQPPEVKQTMQEEEDKLREQGISANAVKVGDQAPDFTLSSSSGQQYHLSELLAKGPVVLIFFRGSW